MTKKRLQLSFIILALLLPLLAACGTPAETETPATESVADTIADTAETTTDKTALAEVEENYDWRAGIEQKNYDGYEYVILNGCTAEWYSYTLIAPEESTGEPVKDAFIERNNRVGEYLNVKIVENNVTDSAAMLKKEVKAGTGDFDIALVTLGNSFAIAMEDSLIDLNTLSSVDFTKTWWDQNAISDLTINGKMYFTTGDFDTTRFDGIRSLFFNKALVEQYQLDDPYALVDEGKWTMDRFTEMCLAVVADLNGDGAMTDADRYGYVAYGELIADILLYGMNERYIGKDPDTGMVTDLSGDERFLNAYDKIINLTVTQQDAVFDVRAKNRSKYLNGLGDRAQEPMFTENKALFYSECMAWSRVLREMEADFGVLPPPKYDEAQERHYSIIINPFMEMIPVTSADPERAIHIMDALHAASHDTVVPAYVNVTLTGKVARDTDTIRMLHLVFDELAYYLSFSNIQVRSIVNGGIVAGTEDIVSKLTANAAKFDEQIAKANAFFFG